MIIRRVQGMAGGRGNDCVCVCVLLFFLLKMGFCFFPKAGISYGNTKIKIF